MYLENIKKGIVELIKKAETDLPLDVVNALKSAYKIETGVAKIQLEAILKNIDLAKKTKRPMCQDTGIQTFFITVGIDFPKILDLKKLIVDAVKTATIQIPIRPNTVDPLTGLNHKDNIGNYIPYITWDFTNGSDVSITAFPKGGGSENMSKLGMLKPGVGIDGVKNFIVDEVIKAGGNPCPPRINKSNIGPMGLGGKTTVLDVHIEMAHRHPASLPVGIVVQCWANRRAHMIIHKDGNWEMK